MMATPTYTAIASITLASTDSEIVFSSIPATYRDLVLVVNGSVSGNSAQTYAKFNNDSTVGNYYGIEMYGNGSSAVSTTYQDVAGFMLDYVTSATTTFNILQIMDYSATDKHKTGLIRNNRAGSLSAAYANRWASTAAINQINVINRLSTFAVGTVISLYGIEA